MTKTIRNSLFGLLLAGGLLAMVETDDPTQKEGWRKRGAVFFRGTAEPTARRSRNDSQGAPAGDGRAAPARGPARET